MSLQAAPASTAAREAAASLREQQYLSFHLAGRTYAVPLPEVAEITPYRELNQIPHMPRSVEGLLDLRGQVIPVINMRVRMGLATQAADQARNIIVLDQGGGSANVGLLVDQVSSVLNANPEQLVPASPLLAGPEGAWVVGFILDGPSITSLLDSRLLTTFHTTGARSLNLNPAHDKERQLDEGLRELIEAAPPKTQADATRIIPQMEEAIAHTEREMEKVLGKVEAMLSDTDQGFKGLVRLKQEAGLGHMKGLEAAVAEIESVGTRLQDEVFSLIQLLQFQDIARQKLERVLNHVRGLQMVVGTRFRDTGHRA